MTSDRVGIWSYSRVLLWEGLRGLFGINDNRMPFITAFLVGGAVAIGYAVHGELETVGLIWVPIALGAAFVVSVARANWEHVLRITETERIVINLLEDQHAAVESRRQAVDMARPSITEVKHWATSRTGVPLPAIRHFAGRLRDSVHRAAQALGELGESEAVDRIYADPLWVVDGDMSRDDLIEAVQRIEQLFDEIVGQPVG